MATAGWNAFIPDLSDDEDHIPTVVWKDSAVPVTRSSALQPVARADRGELPSKRAAAASSDDEVTLAAHRDALVPGNVFLAPPKTTDPPPPWQRLSVKRQLAQRQGKETFVIERKRPRAITRAQPSILPHVAFALAAGILVGLCYDVRTRQRLAVDAGHAARTASAFVTALAHR